MTKQLRKAIDRLTFWNQMKREAVRICKGWGVPDPANATWSQVANDHVARFVELAQFCGWRELQAERDLLQLLADREAARDFENFNQIT